jgi:Spy/CpxP family protein refolding chaperone
VDPDTRSLVAVLAAVCALLVAGAAAAVSLFAARVARDSTRTRHRLHAQTTMVRHDGPVLRARIERASSRIDRLREQWAATEDAMTSMTGTLASMRGSLEGLTRGRLAMLMRGAGIVSKAAQVALLWR